MNRIKLLKAAERLNRYAQNVQRHLQSLDPREQQRAIADLAEVNEISKRLYNAVVEFLNNAPIQERPRRTVREQTRTNR